MIMYVIQYHFQNMKESIVNHCEICHKISAAALESLLNLEDTSAILHNVVKTMP